MLTYVVLSCPMLSYIVLCCPKLSFFTLSCHTLPKVTLSCPTLSYVTLTYPTVGLYCSKTESRVPCGGGGGRWQVVVGGGGGRWCKPIIVSNPTLVELCQVVLRLFWGCVVVELWFRQLVILCNYRQCSTIDLNLTQTYQS